jgi:ATP-dependent DNA ligase
LDSQRRPSFQLLQATPSQSRPIYFYAFDLLNQKGEMLVNLPLSRRRKLLENLLAAPKHPVRLSPLLEAPSREVLEAVRKLGLEGVVGKRIVNAEKMDRCRWVKPKLVCQVAFVEWTAAGHLRHCTFIVMRLSKGSVMVY